MSIWNAAVGVYQAIPNWPLDLKPLIKSASELQCGNTLTLQIEGAALGLGLWLYNTVIPQPRELIRKTVTGSYKCGFYGITEVPSPLDIIWEDQEGSKLLARFANPLVTGLYYWWLSETLWDFMGYFESIFYRAEVCADLAPNECAIDDGEGIYGMTTGAVTHYTPYADPNHWYTSPGAPIQPPVNWIWDASAYGFIYSTDANAHTVRLAIYDPTSTGLPWQASFDIPPFGVASFSLQWELPNPTPIHPLPQVWAQVTNPMVGTGHVRVHVNTFFCTAWPPDQSKPSRPNVCWTPESPAAHSDGWWVK